MKSGIFQQRLTQKCRSERPGFPDDIAKAVLFLASDLASYINDIQCSSPGHLGPAHAVRLCQLAVFALCGAFRRGMTFPATSLFMQIEGCLEAVLAMPPILY